MISVQCQWGLTRESTIIEQCPTKRLPIPPPERTLFKAISNYSHPKENAFYLVCHYNKRSKRPDILNKFIGAKNAWGHVFNVTIIVRVIEEWQFYTNYTRVQIRDPEIASSTEGVYGTKDGCSPKRGISLLWVGVSSTGVPQWTNQWGLVSGFYLLISQYLH